MKRKINEKDAPPGCRAVRATDGCKGCVYEHNRKSCMSKKVACHSFARKDGGVIFKPIAKAHVWLTLHEYAPNKWLPLGVYRRSRTQGRKDCAYWRGLWPTEKYKLKKFVEVG